MSRRRGGSGMIERGHRVSEYLGREGPYSLWCDWDKGRCIGFRASIRGDVDIEDVRYDTEAALRQAIQSTMRPPRGAVH